MKMQLDESLSRQKTTSRLIGNFTDELANCQNSEFKMLSFITQRFWTITDMSDRFLDSVEKRQNLRFKSNCDKNQDYLKQSIKVSQLINQVRKRYSMNQSMTSPDSQ